MPGATPVLGLPYPLLGEPIDPNAFRSLADAIEAAMVDLADETLPAVGVDQALRRPYIRLLPSPGQSVAFGAPQGLSWVVTEVNEFSSFVVGDTIGIAGLFLPNDGLYLVNVEQLALTPVTTVTSHRLRLVWSNQPAAPPGLPRQIERKSETTTLELPATTITALWRPRPQPVGTFHALGIELDWTGTGGPANILSRVSATIVKLCSLSV